MNEIQSDVKRAGALPVMDRCLRLKTWSLQGRRLFAAVSLATLACVASAQNPPAEPPAKEAAAPKEAEGAAKPADSASESASSAQAAKDDATSAPETEGGVPMARFAANNTPIELALGRLSDETKVSISARGKAAGSKVSLIQPKMVPLPDLLNQLVNTQPNWILYQPADRPGAYEIWDAETYKAEVLPRLVRPKVFIPKEITAEEAAKALEGVMTPNIGKVAFDPRSNKVIMTDLVPVLELAQRLLETIDVKFLTRVYYIEHADVNTVAEKLSALKSPAAPDVQTDERTRQIIVSDRLEILQKMEQLVETLDIGPEMRVYTINNLGVEGEELEELETAIEEILTPDAYYHFNVRQGKLIVRDLPEVQERVEKILAAFDAPVRQILLQLEIIETEFSDGFNWSVDYAFSGDLLGAVTDGLVSGVPTGSATDGDGDVVEGSEGFVNFRKEFPVVSAGSSGLSAQMLTRHAFVKLATSMSDSRTRVLQQPRLFVENQKTASFDVGQSVPFFTGGSIGYTNNGNSNNLTPSQPVQQLLQVGLYVEVTPIISGSGIVELELTVENSSPLFRDQVFAGQTYTGVGKTNQELQTTLWIPSGQTRVIGGLVADSKSESRSGIPGLSRIPWIGPALFGSYTKDPQDNRRRNLLIFVTPTIVEENPSDMGKYKGVLMAEAPLDSGTTPAGTLTDIPVGPSGLSNMAQLEKGDYLSYTPPPMPDFDAMSRGTELPSLSHEAPEVKATVNRRPPITDLSNVPEGEVSEGVMDLPRTSLDEGLSTDSLRAFINATGPSGLMSTGSKGLVKPPPPKATPTPAPPGMQPGQPGQPNPAAAAAAAAAAQQNAAQHPPQATAPPPRETNTR